MGAVQTPRSKRGHGDGLCVEPSCLTCAPCVRLCLSQPRLFTITTSLGWHLPPERMKDGCEYDSVSRPSVLFRTSRKNERQLWMTFGVMQNISEMTANTRWFGTSGR